MNRFDSRGRGPGRPSGGGPRRDHDDSGPGRRPPFRPRYQPTAEEQFGDARGLTFEALGAFEHRRAFVSDALEQLFEERNVSPSCCTTIMDALPSLQAVNDCCNVIRFASRR